MYLTLPFSQTDVSILLSVMRHPSHRRRHRLRRLSMRIRKHTPEEQQRPQYLHRKLVGQT